MLGDDDEEDTQHGSPAPVALDAMDEDDEEDEEGGGSSGPGWAEEPSDRQAFEAGPLYPPMTEEEDAQWRRQRASLNATTFEDDDDGADEEGGAVASAVRRTTATRPRLLDEARRAVYYPSNGTGVIELDGVIWPAMQFWTSMHRQLYRQRRGANPSEELDEELEYFDEEDLDTTYNGVWFRGRFYAGATFSGPVPDVSWDNLGAAIDDDPKAPGAYISLYPKEFVQGMRMGGL